MQEIWKPIMGYEGLYSISSLGNLIGHQRTQVVKSRCGNLYTREKYTKIKKHGLSPNGYFRTALIDAQGKKKQFSIHRLVAEAFIPNPAKKPCVNHINGIKTDNHIKNLEWVTYQENTTHARNTLGTICFGEKISSSLLTDKIVLFLRRNRKKLKRKHAIVCLQFQMSQTCFSAMLRGDSWKHIPLCIKNGDVALLRENSKHKYKQRYAVGRLH